MIARRQFTEIPRAKRQSPERIRNIQPRFYVDRYVEHAKAFDLLQSQAHGEGPKLLVRALLYYRDSVSAPLEKLGRRKSIPDKLKIGVLDFTPSKKPGSNVKNVAARLYIDRYREHREAFQFLQDTQQRLGGDANKTIIRALIHYDTSVLHPLYKGT